jgi:hypothetical protein
MQVAGYSIAQSSEFKTQFNKTSMETLNRPEISEELTSKLVYKPLANTLTFGLYSMIAGDSSPNTT